MYEVSSKGRVRNKQSQQVLTQNSLVHRHQYISLQVLGSRKHYSLSHLVCQAFHLNTQNKDRVQHLNGDFQDNHKDNLQWTTMQEVNEQSGKLRQGKLTRGQAIWRCDSKTGEKIQRYDSMRQALEAMGEIGNRTEKIK